MEKEYSVIAVSREHLSDLEAEIKERFPQEAEQGFDLILANPPLS